MTKRILYILLCASVLMASCSSGVISSDHCNLPENGWAMQDTVWLTLSVPDTVQTYDVALTLRHTDVYAYQNLWFFVQAYDSTGGVRGDTVMACLADDRGQWLSTRAGRYYSGYVTMWRDVVFANAGTYNFAIVQGMRDSVVTGIADVGLELRKTDRCADRRTNIICQ